MTPFSPSALVAILLAFYPTVSGAELARARRERPEYFAGGSLGGSHGDKLTLPDGACWDCIFGSGTGDVTVMHWQCIPCGDGTPGDPVFALAPGPFRPLDGSVWPAPAPVVVFVPLVTDALSELGTSDAILSAAESSVAEHSSGAAFDAAVSGAVNDGDAARVQEFAPLLQAVPADVLEAMNDRSGTIDAGEADAEFEPPPYKVPDPPGNPPQDDTPQPGDPTTDPDGTDKRR
jgi:hypothetical protein